MKKESTFKRLLSALLVCAMLVGLLPQIVVAETTEPGSGTAVESITLDKAGMAITKGDTKKLTATVLPAEATDKTVAWVSGNSEVATVHNGVVTALKAGTATITATAGGKSTTCVVTVTEADYNLVTNGGFEDFTTTEAFTQTSGGNIKATGWYQRNGNVTSKVITQAEGSRNGHALSAFRADGQASEFNFREGISSDKLIPGAQYTLTAWVMAETNAESTSSSAAYIHLRWKFATSGTGGGYTEESGSGEIAYHTNKAWTKLTTTITVPADNTNTLYVGFKTFRTKTAGFVIDDVSVVPKNPVAVTALTLNQSAVTLDVGGEATLTATLTGEGTGEEYKEPSNKTVRWMSSNPNVATVIGGKIVALRAGTATITATAGVNDTTLEHTEKTATCVVTVNGPTVEVESIELNKSTTTLEVGQEETLTATVSPDDATDPTVTWESDDEDVATVDANGKITAVSAGTATITATAGDNKTATCVVTVNEPFVAVEGIVLNKNATTLSVGGGETLTATVSPDNATNKTVTWTSNNEAVATVTDGVITAIAVGEATITATAGDGKTATCVVTVNAAFVAVDSISLNKDAVTLEVGENETLTATVLPEDASDKTVNWSSNNEAVATVENGVITAVAPGTATITATAGDGKTDTCVVTVNEPVIAVGSIGLNKAGMALKVGGTQTLTATVLPENATDKTVTWTSGNPAVATVENGVVTAVAAGTAVITATAGDNKTATCIVTVTDDNNLIPNGGFEDYYTTGTVTQESDTYAKTKIAVTDWQQYYAGIVTQVVPGKDNIGHALQITDTEKSQFLYTVPAAQLVPGGTYTLSAVAKALNQTASTSGNAYIQLRARFSGSGSTYPYSVLIIHTQTSWKNISVDIPIPENNTADLEINIYTYRVASGGFVIDNVSLVQKIIDVSGVELNKDATTLEVGGEETLTATISPNNATDKTVTWESDDEDVATVDANGKITAVAVGTATITAKAGENKTATCTVTVIPQAIPVTGITLDKDSITLDAGTQDTLTATVSPADATNKTVSWSSNNEAVATVENGVITAVAPGTATITATAGDGKTDTCVVTVELAIVDAESVSLNKGGVALKVGGTQTLTATVLPEATTDKTVTWTSGNPAVATVENGVVTAVAAGTATITATCGNKSMTCVVTVSEPDGNLLPNGGFEDFKSGQFTQTGSSTNIAVTDWKQSVANAVTEVIADGRTGHALKITGSSASEFYYTIPAEQLLPGREYVLTAYAKALHNTTSTTDSNPFLRLRYKLGSGSYQNDTKLALQTDEDWKKLTMSFTVPLNHTGSLTVGFQTYRVASGGFVIDDVSLVAIVPEVPVTSVELNKISVSMVAGTEETLTATVLPENASVSTVTWSTSDPTVATVDANGKITAVNAGTAVITAISDLKSATCTVEVTLPAGITPVEKVELNKNGTVLQIGGTIDLTATVNPVYATDKTVTFTSSNTAVAIVDATGKVTAIAEGTAVITAQSGDQTDTCTVLVSAEAGLNMLPNGGFEDFKNGVFVQGGTSSSYDNSNIPVSSWKQYNVGVVTEVVTGRNNVGHALKITSSKKTETTYYSDSEFYYSVPASQLTPGGDYILTGYIRALEGTTSTTDSQALIRIRYKLGGGSTQDSTDWRVLQGQTSWKKVSIKITIPENHTGNLTIYFQTMRVKNGGFLIDDLSLVQIPQTVTLPKEETFVELGDTVSLPVTVGPESVLDKRVVYSTSDDTVAVVDATGKVTPVAVGTAIIKVTPINGGPSAECTVYVVEEYVPLEALSIKAATSLQIGGREKLAVTCTPANPSDQKLTWQSSNEAVVKVSADGQLTALSAGTATVTVTGEGGKSAQCVVTVTASTTLSTTAVQLSIPFGKTYAGNLANSVTNNTGAEVSYAIYQNTQMGTLNINADGTYTYLPKPNFDTTKTDSFVLLVTAGGQSALLEGVISVNPITATIQQALVPGTTLMVSREELAAVKAEIAKEGTLQNRIWKNYKKYLQSLLTWQVPAYEDNVEDERERLYAEWQRPVGTNIEHLLFAYLFTDDEAYKNKAIEAAVTSANYYAWGESEWYNEAGLCAGHQGYAISLVYNWLREDLTEQQRNDIVRRMYQTCERVRGRHNTTYIQNTYWVSNSALYAASMALYQYPQDVVTAMQGVEGYEGLTADQVRANCESWIAFGVGIIGNVLERMPQDGTNYEGSGYHQYGMDYMLKNCLAFTKALGVDMFTNAQWLANSSQFYSAVMVPLNSMNASNAHIDFGDSARVNWYGPSHIYRVLAAIYQDETAQWIAEVCENKDVDQLSSSIWMSLLYADPSVEAVSPVEAGRGTLFYGDDLDLIVARSNWTGNEALVMLRCGLPVGKTQSDLESYANLINSNNEDHVDADINALYLYYNGEYLLRTDGYNDKYTGNYSTLLVDGKGQFRDTVSTSGGTGDSDFYKYDAQPYIKKTESTATYDYFVGDATEAYNPELGLTKYERNVILLKEENVLLVLDDIATINPELELELRWFPENKIVTENYGIYTVYGSKTTMKFFPFTTEGVTTAFEDVKVYTSVSKEKAFSQKYTGTSWQNAVAFSWSKVDGEQAIVRYLCGGNNIHKFEVNGKIYTVDIKKNTVSVETGSLDVVDPWADNSELSNILFNGTAMEGFDSKTLNYNIEKFWKTLDVEIVPVAASPSAEVEMNWNGACPGTVTITVTSQDKSSVSTYVINMTNGKGLLGIAGATADAKNETIQYTYDHYFVPSVSGNTWAAKACLPTVIYDMGRLVDISKIDIAFNASSERASYYDLYTSVDGENWTVFAKDQMSAKTPVSAGYHSYATIAENVGRARYVKIYLRGFTTGDTYGDGLDDLNSYKGFQEISIYGTEVEADIIVEETTATVTGTGMSNAMTAAGNKNEVVLDVESADDAATKVVLPTAGLKDVLNADKELVIQLGQATVTLDSDALAAITTVAGNKPTVELTIAPVDEADLEAEQVEALEDYDVAMTFAITLVCDGQTISTFGSGKVTVQIPFAPAEGTLASEYRIAYIADDGKIEILETVAGDGYLKVVLEHFSEYAILRVKVEVPPTGDMQMPLTMLAVLTVSLAAVLVVLVMKQKRYF